MLDKDPLPPAVPLIPASASFETTKPEAGWWDIHVKIKEEAFENGRVVPWPKESSETRRHFELSIYCSNVFDPIPDLHAYIYATARGATITQWTVGQEGSYIILDTWDVGFRLAQLRFRQISDEHSNPPLADYSSPLNLLVDRFDFLEALEKAYCDFGRNGAWQLFGMYDFEDTAPPTDCLQIDSNIKTSVTGS